MRLTSSYSVSRSDYDLAWEGNWNNVRQRVEEEFVQARTGRFKYDFDGNGEFDILGEREALVVTIQPLSQEVALITINIPGNDKTPMEVKAVATELILATEAIMRNTSTIILAPFPTHQITLGRMEGLGEGHQVEPSPRADRATPVKVVVLSADRMVAKYAMIFYTVDSTSKPLSKRFILCGCGFSNHNAYC